MPQYITTHKKIFIILFSIALLATIGGVVVYQAQKDVEMKEHKLVQNDQEKIKESDDSAPATSTTKTYLIGTTSLDSKSLPRTEREQHYAFKLLHIAADGSINTRSLWEFHHPDYPYKQFGALVSPDKRSLVTLRDQSSNTTELVLYDLVQEKISKKTTINQNPPYFIWSPDSKNLLLIDGASKGGSTFSLFNIGTEAIQSIGTISPDVFYDTFFPVAWVNDKLWGDETPPLQTTAAGYFSISGDPPLLGEYALIKNREDGELFEVSPDGRTILWGDGVVSFDGPLSEAKKFEFPWELRLINVDTGEANLLEEFLFLFYPSTTISPDGEWIAYTKDDEIYGIRQDGTEKTLLLDLTIDKEVEIPKETLSSTRHSFLKYLANDKTLFFEDIASWRTEEPESGTTEFVSQRTLRVRLPTGEIQKVDIGDFDAVFLFEELSY